MIYHVLEATSYLLDASKIQLGRRMASVIWKNFQAARAAGGSEKPGHYACLPMVACESGGVLITDYIFLPSSVLLAA
jgi:hypothetical protein